MTGLDNDFSLLQAVLLDVLALPESDFVSQAGLIHKALVPYLAREAQRQLSQRAPEASASHDPLRSSVLLTFHKLASLERGVPVDITSLHDFVIAFTGPGTQDEYRALARSLVSKLFRKKPSRVRAVETQLMPGYIAAFERFSSQNADWTQAIPLSSALLCLCGFPEIRDVLASTPSATMFWTAFQKLYDVSLPVLYASHLENASDYTTMRFALVRIFSAHASKLSMDTVLALLEAEGSSPDLPVVLSDDDTRTLINQSLLADSHFYYSISTSVASAASQEEKAYLESAIEALVQGRESIIDGRTGRTGQKSQAKGKGREIEHDPAQGVQTGESVLVTQVLAILPDIPPELVSRHLGSAACAGLSDEAKVQHAIQAALDGALGESPIVHEARETSNSSNTRSAMAATRSNIFEDRIDLSRTQIGKQSIKNDPFLPAELKAAILKAAETQKQEEEEQEDEDEDRPAGRTAAFAEDLESDEDESANRVVRVRDNVDEESDAEDEDKRMQASGASASRTASGTNTPRPSGAMSQEIESMLLSKYASSPGDFASSARKNASRAVLRKDTGLSDEQLEGWARMLERNPRRDALLAAATEFRGNVKGQEVRPGKGSSGGKGSTRESGGQHTEGSRGGGRGGQGGRGRGNTRGRGHQNDARKRGHDRKVAKSGV